MKKLMFLTVAIVALFAASTVVNAQKMNLKGFKYKGSTLGAGASLKRGEGLLSPGKSRVFVLQQDGNLCLYKLEKGDLGTFIKCTMTTDGDRLDMQQDGNLALYNAKGEHLWSTDTYRGNNNQKGAWIWMSDTDGKSVQMTAKDSKTYIWNFEGTK